MSYALADVVAGWVEHIRRPGKTTKPYFDRLMLSAHVEIEDVVLDTMILTPGTIAEISSPDRTGYGWGLNPAMMRPDETGTHAREWIAAMGLKTATNVDNVPIAPINRNVCPSDAWRGPDASGRYFCRSPYFDEDEMPPEAALWFYDYGAYSLNAQQIEAFPTLTLAGTGLMDAGIPGGHVPHILGSTALADPEWEGCTWPETFIPDEMATADVYARGVHTFTAQTFRFDRPEGTEIRLALATNWRRAFCFEGLR